MRHGHEDHKEKNLIASESALSPVIGAVLVLGLFILIIGVIRASYIPVWISDAESDHMEDAWLDMAELKNAIDYLSAVVAVDPANRFSVNTPIEMGGGDIPMIHSRKSSGTISINVQDSGMTILAENSTGAVMYDSGTNLTGLGTIRYSSSNQFYLDQVYAYENGALILEQSDRSLLKLSPGLSITKPTSSTVNVIINAIEIDSASRTMSSNGAEEVYIMPGSSNILFSGIIADLTISIATDYPSAWAAYFNRSAQTAGLTYGTDYTVTPGGRTGHLQCFHWW